MKKKAICVLIVSMLLAATGGAFAWDGLAGDAIPRLDAVVMTRLGNGSDDAQFYGIMLRQGAPLRIGGLACVVRLAERGAQVRLVQDAEFAAIVQGGPETEAEAVEMTPTALGLEVVAGARGVYLLGDFDAALELLGGMAGQQIERLDDMARFEEQPVPLSAGGPPGEAVDIEAQLAEAGGTDADARSVSVYMDTKKLDKQPSSLTYGDTAHLRGRLTGYDGADVTFQWQSRGAEDEEWRNIEGANGIEYAFVIDEENASWLYRLEVTVIDA